MFDNSIFPGRLSVPPKTIFDFTSAVLDPRVTFSRTGTTATLINSSGLVQAAGANVPRFDFDFSTGLCRGLLVEEARTNIYIYSEELNRAITINSTVATDVAGIAAPDGTITAEKIEENTTNGQHAIERQFASAIGDYSMSGFFKAAERTSIRLNLSSTTQNAIAVFNLTNGTIVSVTAQTGTVSATITPLANGWYRCTISATQPDTRTLQARFALIQSGTTHSYAGTTGFGAYAWGAQLERNPFPTSYIKTEATSVVRNADIATITGANFSGFWQAGKGSTLVKARPSTISGTRPWVQFDDATADNIIALRGNTTNPELYIRAAGSDQAQIDAGTIAANTRYRLAGAWATNDCAASINSGAAVRDGVATIPVVTQARLGSDGTNYLNGHLEAIEYYDDRQRNSALQILSSQAGRRSILSPIIKNSIFA